jgi:hypothetical protein
MSIAVPQRLRWFCAVWLLVLCVSPFTAPFSTCDLARDNEATPFQDGWSAQLKLSGHKCVVSPPGLLSPVVSAASPAYFRQRPASLPPTDPILSNVLRL